MTIQRQYILPNCSLVLEGLSTDASNVLSILANAEFKVVGLEKPLAGGSDFFKAVVQAVSAYCQRLLSGLDHPNHTMDAQGLVAVEPDAGQYHRLMIKPELLEGGDETSGQTDAPQSIRLSTVQLFDMAEAIDQFNADAQTLPDLAVELAPLPRRYVRSSEPLAQRAIPPLLGLGTLAVAALGLFFLPVPELAEPDPLEQQATALEDSGLVVEDDGAEADPPEVTTEAAESTPEEAAAPVQNTAITDSAQLAALQQQVQQQITSSLPADASFDQSLRYQISVAENGDIVGYNPLDSKALASVDDTPLPSLTYIPVDNGAVGPIAQFDLTLAADGAVEVVSNQVVTPETADADAGDADAGDADADDADAIAPTPPASDPDPQSVDPAATEATTATAATAATEAPSTPGTAASDDPGDDPVNGASSGTLEPFVATPIQDADRIYELNQELRRTLINNRETDWSGAAIIYRVRLDNDGNITGYEPDDAAAESYAPDLKLPNLVKTAPTDKPQLDFLVVISEDNIVEVSPWDGWPLE